MILHHGVAAGGEAMLVPEPLENPLGRVTLLLASITGNRGPSFGFSGGFARVYPGGSENRHIFSTVWWLSPKTRAASRRLCPSRNTKCRTAA